MNIKYIPFKGCLNPLTRIETDLEHPKTGNPRGFIRSIEKHSYSDSDLAFAQELGKDIDHYPFYLKAEMRYLVKEYGCKIIKSYGIPCHKCDYCLMRRARSHIIRGIHEQQLYKKSVFLTLTYSEEFLPRRDMSSRGRRLSYSQNPRTLFKKDVMDFNKRLRIHLVRQRDKSDQKILHEYKYDTDKLDLPILYAGEYGSENGRPHYHGIYYNLDFADKFKESQSLSQKDIYISPTLDKLWQKGRAVIQNANARNITYVMGYTVKQTQYSRYVCEQQEIQPEFIQSPTQVGLGRRWYEQHKSEIFDLKSPNQGLIYQVDPETRKKHAYPIPKYYYDLLKKDDPFLHEQLRESCREHAIAIADDFSEMPYRERLNAYRFALQDLRTKRQKQGKRLGF